MKEKTVSYYRPLLYSAGFGSILGSGIIVGIASTITVWQKVLNLSAGQVGLISSLLTFSIAAGSLLAGNISKKFGLIRAFNFLNIFFIIGTLLVLFANNFVMLVCGTVIAGFISGADLPISLTVISHDAPNKKISAELVSGTQVYWTVGMLVATIVAFLTSTLPGAMSAQIVMGVLLIIACLTLFMRNNNAKLKKIHTEAQYIEKSEETVKEKVSVFKLLFGKDKKYLMFFICILVFYCGWNLLSVYVAIYSSKHSFKHIC